MVRLLLMTLVLGCATLQPAHARDALVVEFRNGDGARDVGLVGSQEDAEGSGPTAITIGDDGVVYVLDQNNGRVLAVDGQRSQEEPRILDLPSGLDGQDLAVVRNTLYLWSDGPVALKTQAGPSGEPGRAMRAEGGEADDYTRSVFAAMGSQTPGSLNEIVDEIGRSARPSASRPEIRQFVPSRGLGDIVATVSYPMDSEVHFSLRRAASEDSFLEFSARSSSRVGTVELLDIDATGRPYALVEMLATRGRAGEGLAVVRFSPDGDPDRIYDLPITPDSLPTRRSVAIGPRGDVLFLRSTEGRAQVLRLDGRTPSKNGMLAPLVQKDASSSKDKRKSGAMSGKVAVRPSNREQVIERAVSFETTTWTVNDRAYGPQTPCPGMKRSRQPGYIIGKLGQTVKGIPYCWGCKTSPSDFLAGLEDGRMAGNVCTKSAPVRNVLGVDCSSFVSETWGLSTHVTTSAIPAITTPVRDPWSLRPGDALNKAGSHVMLVLRLTPDRKVEVMEASPNACRGTVCRNVYSLGTLMMRGYRPVRFKGLDG
jgi:hypothetical protein